MKVLQINSVCGSGSTGAIVVDLYYELVKLGYECCIAYGRGDAPADIKTYRIGNDMDVCLHGIFSRITDKHGFYSSAATKRFVQWMEIYNPDIIHLHNLHGYFLNIEMLFQELQKLNKPVIWTLHDCWSFTGHCAYFTSAGCEKWKSNCSHCMQLKEYPKSLYYDNCSKNFIMKKKLFSEYLKMQIVTPSIWLEGLVKESFLKGHMLQTIYNGIDFNIYKPRKSNWRKQHHLENKTVLLGVANIWSKRKGMERFYKLAKCLDKDLYQIVLVGAMKHTNKEAEKKIITILQTQNRIELAEIYSAADIFINFSEEETMGLTTVEAIACGTPALVYNRTALPEILGIEKYCLYTDDVSEWIDKIEHIDKNDFNIEDFQERFDKHKQYKKYIELYEEKLL